MRRREVDGHKLEEMDHFLETLKERNGVPYLQGCSSSSLVLEISANPRAQYQPNEDHQSYFTGSTSAENSISTLEGEQVWKAFHRRCKLTLLSSIGMIERGHQLSNMLYSYRSVSEAIPEISIEIPEDATPEEYDEITSKKAEINRKVLEILRPEIHRLRELMSFSIEAIDCFYSCVFLLTKKEIHNDTFPGGIHYSLINLLDILVILDNLKDLKVCIYTDFDRYKRVLGSNLTVDAVDEIKKLEAFIGSDESQRFKSFIFSSLTNEVRRIKGYEHILTDSINIALDLFEKQLFLRPEEHFKLLRVIPYLMLLTEGNSSTSDKNSFNIFETKAIRVHALQKLYKAFPVIQLYGEATITVDHIFQSSIHFAAVSHHWVVNGVRVEQDATDRDDLTTVLPSDISDEYDLLSPRWKALRKIFNEYTARLTVTMHRYSVIKFQNVLDAVTVATSKEVTNLVMEGFRHLSNWNILIRKSVAWKYTSPCSDLRLMEMNVDIEEGAEALIYARAVKHNFTPEELTVMVDIIVMIKSTASLLQKAETVFAPYMRFHTHHVVQQLVQGDLTPLLHRLDKRNKPSLSTLVKLRAVAADWLNGVEPHNDYRDYSRKDGYVSATHPPRICGPSPTQLYILRSEVYALLSGSGSEISRKGGIFAKADLERADVVALTEFYNTSFFFPYLLAYPNTLREVSYLGDLWYRELYLELTKCRQFPIDLSLPWMLVEHLVSSFAEAVSTTAGGNGNNSVCQIDNVLFVLDIYNDAAHRSLYGLSQQYLYDELQAEVNLAIDQFYFILTDAVYDYYKNFSASVLLEKGFKSSIERLKGQESLTVQRQRIELLATQVCTIYTIYTIYTIHTIYTLYAQRHVQLLGRSINLNFILCQNINNRLYRDVDLTIRRFESADMKGVVELAKQIDILRRAHTEMVKCFELDRFNNIVCEVNGSVRVGHLGGRISNHAMRSLVHDLFPNNSYNYYTNRFVASPIPMRPYEYRHHTAMSSKQGLSQVYGVVCGKAYESCARLYRGFFGKVHIEAYLSLGMHLADVPLLMERCLANLQTKMKDIGEYLHALKNAIPPNVFPSFGSPNEAYSFYEERFRTLLVYDDLKPEV